ncbi:structural polyprotein [Fort Morgan virus]|uniref:Structural polyprotein n=5 Tax=Fort Morgan virus TaxID=48544 RepID=D1KRD8_9VIRU|nr:structural polyprotein [Fort Morgan virus]ACT68009.1 structural polyprotein [Fort Morgan virus]
MNMFPYPTPSFQAMYPAPPMAYRDPNPPRRRWRPFRVPLAAQIEELRRSIANLTFKQRKPQPPAGPPAKKRKTPPKPKNQQRKKTKPHAKKQRSKPKPGKRQRLCMKLESDKTFPVVLNGQINGYACVVGGRLMKPLHVEGKIDNEQLAAVKLKKASMYDLEYGDVPQNMKSDTLQYTSEKPPGFYNWHHGAVQYENGRFSVPRGVGGKGDSGRPILDNKGRVVAIVLGGVNEGSRTALSVVTWNQKGVTIKITPEGTEPWSLIPVMCALANITFPCNQPPVCYARNPELALDILEENADSPAYDELLQNIVRCTARRAKRSVTDTYSMTEPYLGRCPVCRHSEPCYSPVKIEHVWDESDDGTLRIQTSALFGSDSSDKADAQKYRYMTNKPTLKVAEGIMEEIKVSTSGPCRLINYSGYFLLVHCPPGDSITVSIVKGGVLHSCTVEKRVQRKFVGREQYQFPPLHGKSVPCNVYNSWKESSAGYITMHRQGPYAYSTFLEEQQGKVYVNPPSGKTVTYECNCSGHRIGTTAQRVEITLCKRTKQCIAYLSNQTKWVFNSPDLMRSTDHSVKGKLHIPFNLTPTTCLVPLAHAPTVTSWFKGITLHLTSRNPTLLTTRKLGADADSTAEWITGTTTRNFSVGREGLEYVWGNLDPVRVWAQESAPGDPHGWPHEIIQHYYHRHPVYTIAVLTGIATFALIGLSASLHCLCRARRDCITPYALAPNATVPTIIALFCCVRPSHAETVGETLTYLWSHNQPFLWAQLCIPVAALVILLRCASCCLPFLLVAGVCLGKVDAYEHATTVPNVPGVPYKALVERSGYAPLNLEVMVVSSELVPTVNKEYITCKFHTVIPSPKIKCCGILECSAQQRADYACRVFGGVYPFMWGGAQCFCDTENTQMSEAYVVLSPDCKADHAVALKVHTASLKVNLRITYGNTTTNVITFVNGVTPGISGALKVIAGPISAAFTPFDNKVVINKGLVYNYDFPEYGAMKPGAFGDIQASTIDGRDLVARTDIRLLKPSAKNIHVPFTQAASGYEMWKNNSGRPLQDTAPFGCRIAVDPLRAENCTYGSIPISLDIPDATFLRVSDSPVVTVASCSVTDCVYSADFGGVAGIDYVSDREGQCPVHSHSSTAVLKESLVHVMQKGSITLHFSTSSPQANFIVSLCGKKTTCHAQCKPPADHIIGEPHKVDQEFQAAVSKTSWSWMLAAIGGVSSLVIIGLIALTCSFMFISTRK